MPLIHGKSGKALAENMRTLHADIGKSPHVQSAKQAVAIALETQRRAGGGKPKPKKERRSFRNGQVSDRARDRMGEDVDRVDAATA